MLRYLLFSFVCILLAGCQADQDSTTDRSAAVAPGNRPDRPEPRVLDKKLDAVIGDTEAVENLNPKNPADRPPIRVTAVRMDEVPNPVMANKGENFYNSACQRCHAMQGSSQATALGDILDRRDPAWIMNFLYFPGFEVNPAAEGRCWVREPSHILNVVNARDLLEYFRVYDIRQKR